MRTREEHLAFCKTRAHEYLKRGDVANAVTSMLSDLSQHPETHKRSHMTLTQVGMNVILSGNPEEARRFIDGFR